jgi:hypothetical protein
MRVRRASEWAVKCALRDLRREDETVVEYFILYNYYSSSYLLWIVLWCDKSDFQSRFLDRNHSEFPMEWFGIFRNRGETIR